MFEGATNVTESPRQGILRDDLDDFVAVPVTPPEVKTKDDFYLRVQPWLSQAMMVAGYPLKEMDDRLKLVFEKKDFFNRDAESIAADVNRIINNWVVEARTFAKAYDAEVVLQSSPFAPKEQPIRGSDDPVPSAVVINTKAPNLNSNSSIENIREAENVPLATEFEEREAEYAEYGNRNITSVRTESKFAPAPSVSSSETAPQPVETIKPETLILQDKLPDTLVLHKEQILPDPLILTKEQILPDTLVLTPEMQVVDSNEPIVLETVEEGNASSPEKLDLANAYQVKLDALNSQPFNHDAYFEFVFDVHTGLRHEYDEVVNAARNNLKRFDGFYAPSTVEKQALQLLSSLQGQYAKMQNPESDYGLSRGALTEKLSIAPTEAIEADIKVLSQDYLDATKKLFANISKLNGLVEVVKTEEKPTVAEVYRAQFEKIQTEGNQVLRSLPADHPLYERLKTAIESDLADLIKNAAIENGGDTAVLQNSSNFMARRDQIKNLIAFIKDEQEYQDFFGRARSRVQKLESQFETIPASEQGAQVKTILAENIVKIKQALSGTDSQIATVGVLENLKQQKSIIEMLLRDSEESITSLPQSETVVPPEVGSRVLTDAELIAFIEKTPLAQNMAQAQERYQMRQGEIEKYLAFKREQQSSERFSGPAYEKAKRLAGMLHLGKIGKAAAVLLALAGPAGLSSQKSDLTILGNPNLSAGMLAQSNVDYVAISEYLRTAEGSPTILETVAPEVSDVAPELPKAAAPVETVPGVILPDTVSSIETGVADTPPDYYSDDAVEVQSDPGIVFESPTNANVPEALRQPYKINIGDTFWDINEGETLAGKLPVLSQINPYFKQALIDRMRDRINNDPAKRAVIGGFGNNADQLRAGELMNLDKLNELGVDLAVEYGYLK